MKGDALVVGRVTTGRGAVEEARMACILEGAKGEEETKKKRAEGG